MSESRNPDGVDALLVRWHQHGDRKAREQLLRFYERQVYQVADQMAHKCRVDRDDARQVGLMAFTRAIDDYEPGRASLMWYARARIRAAVIRLIATREVVDRPKNAHTVAYRARRAVRELEAEGVVRPTEEQVAAHMGVKRSTAAMALQVSSRSCAMLGDAISDGLTLGDVIPGPDTERPDRMAEQRIASQAIRTAVLDAIADLSPSQAGVARLCLLEGLDMAEAAERLGVTRQATSSAMKRVIPKMREALASHPLVAEMLAA